MAQKDQPVRTLTPLRTVNHAAVLQAVWLLLFVLVIGLLFIAVPSRYQMLAADVYGFGQGLTETGVSLHFFALYFIFWELVLVSGSLLVAGVIGRRKADDPFAMLVAILLTLLGITVPLFDGLSWLSPRWLWSILAARFILMVCAMAVVCLFPNGRFQPRWTRWIFVGWLITLVVGHLIKPDVLADTAVLPNTRTLADASHLLVGAAWFLIAIAGQIFRYRLLSIREERQQTKWVLLGFLTMIMFSLVSTLLLITVPLFRDDARGAALFILIMGPLYLLSALLLPITIALAMLRYRLWKVDLYINRTLVYGGLSLGIVAVYVLVVGSLGTLFQAQGSVFFALLATGLIAVLFQPLHKRLQRAINHLMFGERDDPYSVLSKLGTQLQTTATPQAMLQSVVETIAASLKLPYAAIQLSGENDRLEVAKTGKVVGDRAELPLRYQNETIGFLVVSSRSPGESFTEREQQLLADIAAQTGAIASSVRLTAALQRSREKLVMAREEERRRIRRDLHDGLGPTLASQTFTMDAVLDLLQTDPQEAAQLVRDLKAQNQETVAEIRRLVYELRPPVLDELGLVDAVRAHMAQFNNQQSLQISITPDPDPLPTLSAAVEVAAYRIVLEAVTNVVRHAEAQHCTVYLNVSTNHRPHLHIEVKDDGKGLPLKMVSGVGLRSIRERAEELGGSLIITDLNKGTQVSALLPLAPLANYNKYE